HAHILSQDSIAALRASFSRCWKPEQCRSRGCKQSGAVLGSALHFLVPIMRLSITLKTDVSQGYRSCLAIQCCAFDAKFRLMAIGMKKSDIRLFMISHS